MLFRSCEKKTYAEIGQQIGRTKSYAQYLYLRAKWIQGAYEDGEKVDIHFGLSSRSRNICETDGIMGRKEITEAIKSGKLHPTKQRNHGWKTYIEICEWAGLPTPIRP